MSFALVLPPRQCLADICHPIKSMPRKNWDYWSLKVNHVFLSSLSQSFGQSKTHIGNGMMTWEYWCKCRKSEEKKLEMSKKSNKCNQFGESLNQCDSASSHASNLRTHSKIHTGKSQTNATSATMRHLKQAIWRNIWKYTTEKSNASNVTLPPLSGGQFEDPFRFVWSQRFEDTFENIQWRKSLTNATNALWGHCKMGSKVAIFD